MTRNVAAVRRGVTLIEVLTAIFIMAIGLMALLTLFPLGALSMAQAVKDDRTGTASRNAEGDFRAYWRYAVDQMLAGTLNQPDQNFYAAMMDPDGSTGPMPDRTGKSGPSYPVYVDGFGWLKNPPTGTYPGWLADRPLTILRRAPFWTVTNQPPADHPKLVVQHFSSPDDITLGTNGVPGNPLAVERQRRYSYAFLIRQLSCLDTRATRDLELTVVVYSNRPLQLSPDLLAGEIPYTATFTQNLSTATLTWDMSKQEKPPLRRGSWILDATMPTTANSTVAPRGYFYRVVNVTDGSVTGTIATTELELETTARGGDGTANSTAIVLEGVVEVFDRGVVAE